MTNIKNSGITQLDYIMSILTLFEEGKPELGVTEIAQKTGLSKGAVSRNLQAMASWDLVTQDQISRKYSLGMKLFQLGSAVHRIKLLCERAHPIMEKLAKITNKTIGLMVRQANVAISVHQVDPEQWPLFSNSSGREYPLYAGSSPKILLAHCPTTTQEEYFKSLLKKGTAHNSKVDINKLQEDLIKIRKKGFSISHSEVDAGIMSVSVPIWGMGSEPIATLGVLWAESNTSIDEIDRIISLAKKTSKEISGKMGFISSQNRDQI